MDAEERFKKDETDELVNVTNNGEKKVYKYF